MTTKPPCKRNPPLYWPPIQDARFRAVDALFDEVAQLLDALDPGTRDPDDLGYWMAATGAALADYLDGGWDLDAFDEDAAHAMGPSVLACLVGDVRRAVEWLGYEAAAQPLQDWRPPVPELGWSA